MKRKNGAWMSADAYGRALPKFTVNLLVREVRRAMPFYRDVLGAAVHYSDEDFAALELQGTQFMLHADHAYDHHPVAGRLKIAVQRGTGVELRVMGIDPDQAQARARAAKVRVVQEARDFPQGWRDVMLEDPDGYIWSVGVAI